MALDDALMHINDLLEQEYNLVNSALNDLRELKRERPQNPVLPDSILEALERIISSTSTLHDTVFMSLLKSDSPLWKIDDPRVCELRRMNAEVNSEQLQLYLDIKGYTWHTVNYYHFETPNRETHPIKYILKMLKCYKSETWHKYAPIRLVVEEFIERFSWIIDWYQFLEQDMMPREERGKQYDARLLRSLCSMHSDIFGPLLNHILEPFLLDMEVYESYFIKIKADIDNYSDALAVYKERYKTQMLERIRRLLLDVAQFLRGIPYDDEIKTNLCQNIAFCIETTCGLYNPLESLFEKATPIMIRYMDMHKREHSPDMFEAKRARS